MSNETVTECHGTRHVTYTVSLWCTPFSMPPFYGRETAGSKPLWRSDLTHDMRRLKLARSDLTHDMRRLKLARSDLRQYDHSTISP